MSGCHTPYTMGNVAFNMPGLAGYCNCPCHLSTWMGIYPPTCYCKCTINAIKPNPPTILYLENKKMDQKIKALEERLAIVEQWKKIAKLLCDQSRKPYSCPRCSDSSDRNHTKNCISCEGKGIVWG